MNILPTLSFLFLLFNVQRSDSLFTGSNFFLSVLVKFPNYNHKKRAFSPECLSLFSSCFFPHFPNDSQIHHDDFGAAGILPLSTER